MASRVKTLADAIVSAINAFPSLPDGVQVMHVGNVEHLVNDLPADVTATIAVIISEIEDESLRGEVADAVTLGVVTIANLDSTGMIHVDPWYELTDKLRDHFRSSSSLKTIDVGNSLSACRNKVETPVPCDADILNEDEVFISVTTLRYTISIGNR